MGRPSATHCQHPPASYNEVCRSPSRSMSECQRFAWGHQITSLSFSSKSWQASWRWLGAQKVQLLQLWFVIICEKLWNLNLICGNYGRVSINSPRLDILNWSTRRENAPASAEHVDMPTWLKYGGVQLVQPPSTTYSFFASYGIRIDTHHNRLLGNIGKRTLSKLRWIYEEGRIWMYFAERLMTSQTGWMGFYEAQEIVLYCFLEDVLKMSSLTLFISNSGISLQEVRKEVGLSPVMDSVCRGSTELQWHQGRFHWTYLTNKADFIDFIY